MDSEKLLPATPPAMLWTGRVLSALPALMLIMSGVMKILKPAMVVEGFTKSGFNPDVLVGLGIVELSCTILYLVPQTAVLGAILLTGYMGGAIATHLRLGEPYIVQTVFGVVLWLGLFLRDARLRTLIPFRESMIK